jgi:hypothetical protein
MDRVGLGTFAPNLMFGNKKTQQNPTRKQGAQQPAIRTLSSDVFQKSVHQPKSSSIKFGGGSGDEADSTDAPASGHVTEASSHVGMGAATTAAVTQANQSAASATTSAVSEAETLFKLLKDKTLPKDLAFVAGKDKKDDSRGRHGEVFTVGDQYVLKAPYKEWEKSGWKGIRVTSPDQIKMSDSTYRASRISYPIAEVHGEHGERFKIQNRVLGKQGSVPYVTVDEHAPMPDADYETKFLKKYKEFLNEMADMPLEAYQELIQNIKTLDAAGDCIDPNANNLMVDTAARRLGLVDIDRKKDKHYPPGHENNLNYILTLLVDHNFPNWESYLPGKYAERGITEPNVQKAYAEKRSAQNDPALLPLRHAILKNALQAACTENFVKLPNESQKDRRLYKLSELLKSGGLNDSQIIPIRAVLEGFADVAKTPEQRAQLAESIGKKFDEAASTSQKDVGQLV